MKNEIIFNHNNRMMMIEQQNTFLKFYLKFYLSALPIHGNVKVNKDKNMNYVIRFMF